MITWKSEMQNIYEYLCINVATVKDQIEIDTMFATYVDNCILIYMVVVHLSSNV